MTSSTPILAPVPVIFSNSIPILINNSISVLVSKSFFILIGNSIPTLVSNSIPCNLIVLTPYTSDSSFLVISNCYLVLEFSSYFIKNTVRILFKKSALRNPVLILFRNQIPVFYLGFHFLCFIFPFVFTTTEKVTSVTTALTVFVPLKEKKLEVLYLLSASVDENSVP